MNFRNKLECLSLEVSAAESNVIEYGSILAKLSTFQMLYSMIGYWPYPSTIYYAGKAYQGQTL
jgi:hypothetical protein